MHLRLCNVLQRTAIVERCVACWVLLGNCTLGDCRVQFKFGGFLLTPRSPTVTHVCAIFNFDPMLSVVPYWLLNFVSEKFCLLLIKFMRTAAKSVTDPKSMFARRIRENPEVYEEIGRRMKLYLADPNRAFAA